MRIEEFIEAIGKNDWKELDNKIKFQLPDMSNPTEEKLLAIIDAIPRIVENYKDSYSFEFEGKTITWFRYESLIWALGETFRQILKEKRSLRKKPQLFNAIKKIATEPVYGKGRESFVMLLGQYGGTEQIPTLRKLLSDQEVCGHAVYSLRLLSASEAADEIRPFLNSNKTWVRNEAKKFFEKNV